MEERETQARWLRFGGALTALAAVAMSAGPAGGEVRTSADATVTATASNTFEPATVTINQGETVTWMNSGGGNHNVIFEDGVRYPPSGSSSAAWTFPRTFSTPGTYSYYCSVHQNQGMTGTVTVNPAPVPPPTGGGPPPPSGGYPPPPGGTQPGTQAPGAPGAGKSATTVTLQVSDATPTRGARIRFFGAVKPEQDGRLLQLQRRARGGSYRTVARIKLTDAGASRSKFSKRLRVLGDAVFRARLPADSGHELGTSRAKRLDVH
jgi:plastocyanin